MIFISKYSNDKEVSAAQFITELICENKARIDKKDLHYKFWLNKEWANFFKNQIASAHKLLKQYDAIDIIRALKTNNGRKIFSLRAKHFIPLVIAEKQKSESMNKKSEDLIIERKEQIKIKEHKVKSNILSKLKDLE